MDRLAGTAIKDRAASKVSPDKDEVIFWHRDLPPLDAEAIEEHIVEAQSRRVLDTLVHRTEVWDHCYENLMTQARTRLQQEVLRLEGDYAHVLDETVDSKHDGVTGEAWLHGRFTYMLYRRPKSPGNQ